MTSKIIDHFSGFRSGLYNVSSSANLDCFDVNRSLGTIRALNSGFLMLDAAADADTKTDIYHWRELPQVSFLSRQKYACHLSRKNYVCRDKTRQKFCRDKHTFVATKDVFCRDKHMFVATKTILVAATATGTP